MQTIVKEIISRDTNYKVSISQRSEGLYIVNAFRWIIETVPDLGEVGAFWEPISRPSLTDTLIGAEELAEEELKNWVGHASV